MEPIKPLLVLVNPASGRKKAPSVWRRDVEPLLRRAKWPLEVVVTERGGHAREVLEANPGRWSAVAIFSGDGLVHEVVQAFLRDETTALPLIHVPCGSGNGLARSMCDKWSKKQVIANAASAITGRRTLPLDLVRVRMASGNVVNSVLSIGLGFLADVDVESERFRCLGGLRFTVQAFIRIVSPRSVTLRIRGEGPDGNWTEEDDYLLVHAVNVSHITETLAVAPKAKSDDGLLWLLTIRARSTKKKGKALSKKRFYDMLQTMDKGKSLGAKYASVADLRPLQKLAITPLEGNKPRLLIDGEVFDPEAIEAEVIPSQLKVLVP